MSTFTISQSVESFLSNRASLKDYQDVIDEVFWHYAKSEQFAAGNTSQREKTVDCLLELKQLMSNLEKTRGLPCSKPEDIPPMVVDAKEFANLKTT